MIRRMKYPGYFLIVWDFIRHAREQGIPVGPGRGSAAGSLVAYCLRITDVDPLHFDLYFERFLNPERVSLPDIDIDFCERRRGEVINYVTAKYGRENVAQIITFGTMKARAVVRDVGRVMEMSVSEVDRVAKLIPAALDMTLDMALEESPPLA
jgi:DNA polymerase-3 subunit alpha